MSQITIYLDDSSERQLKAAAAAAGLSVSRWIAELIREKTGSEWPQEVRELAGSWTAFPEADELRKGGGQDAPREAL